MAELVIGAVSFTFQAFAGCIQAYELISDACHARKEYETLLIKLKVEEHRLLDWGRSVGIDFTDDQLLLNHMSKGLIMGILEQQQKLLVSFGKLDKSYRALEKPDLVETEVVFNFNSDRLLESGDDKAIRFPNTDELINKVRIFTDKLKIAPKKLKWAIDGAEKMTALVNNLIYFNNKLDEVLDKNQRDSLFELQMRTNYQIILLNQNVSNLMQIIQAQRITTPASYLALSNGQGYGPGSFSQQVTTPGFETGQLVGLAQFKAINLQIEGSNRIDDIDDTFAKQIDLNHSASDIRQTKIEFHKISVGGLPEDDLDVRTLWQYEGRNVWIEWKDDELNYGRANGTISKTHERISKLAALLKEMNKTVQFRAPECLGYFEDEDNGRFGFVFAKPSSIPADEAPTTLRELLSGAMPPFADRITLMRLVGETVERLHAVSWLHKGLRSANILFFKASTGEINFANPYISGFEYSRPSTREDMTQKPSDDLAADLYRHPKTQSGNNYSAGFLKSFDMYSLGVVLLEIAYWQPIEDVLSIDMNEIRPRHTQAVKQRLLAQEEGFRRYVRAHLGVTVENVIWACLQGPSGFGLAEGCDEREASVGANLQWEFGERVVKKLALMKGL